MNISKIIESVKQIPCSEHSIQLLGGSQGKVLVTCEHCKQRWVAEEFPSGEQGLQAVPPDYILPTVPKEVEKPVDNTPILTEPLNRDVGRI